MNKNEREQDLENQREKKPKRPKTEAARLPAATASTSLVHVDPFLQEEEFSNQMTSDEVLKRFKETAAELKEAVRTVLFSKRNRSGADLKCSVMKLSNLIIMLKQLSRLDKHRLKNSRDTVNEQKQKVDNLNLQYQNLVYEATYLEREMTKCLEFRSKDEDIELVSVEKFYKEAPPEISKREKTEHDEHELTLARLRWELEQRKRLAAKLHEAEMKKEATKKNIKKLKERLDNIQPSLRKILEATEPLQAKLGMPLTTTQLKHKTAKYLPSPLYVLYVESCTYRQLWEKKLQVNIEGSVDDAKFQQFKVDEYVEDSGESDQDENITHHQHSVSDRPKDTDDDMLNKHPLSVCLTILEKGAKIIVKFDYLIHLHIVTVSVKSISIGGPIPVAIGNLLNFDSFLDCLFPGDDGMHSPNPANNQQLSNSKWGENPFSHDKTGLPYVWAQKISGLSFLPVSGSDKSSKVPFNRNGSTVEMTVLAIKSRLQGRISLCAQMRSLELGLKVPAELASMFPSKVISVLKKWDVASWENIVAHPNFKELLAKKIITPNVLIYQVVIERGSAELTAIIAIFPEYPVRSPVFLLFLDWRAPSTAASNMSLRELEEEVNVHCVENLPEQHRQNLLFCQTHHLLACFDIFLETEQLGEFVEGPREFVKEKIITKPFRGRAHSRPYKFLSAPGIFTHR